jgi:hypothetical protein
VSTLNGSPLSAASRAQANNAVKAGRVAASQLPPSAAPAVDRKSRRVDCVEVDLRMVVADEMGERGKAILPRAFLGRQPAETNVGHRWPLPAGNDRKDCRRQSNRLRAGVE